MPTVIVHNDNFEKAFRKWKKKVQMNGTLVDLREKQHYEKPSVRKNRAKAAAKMRWKKYLRDSEISRSQF